LVPDTDFVEWAPAVKAQLALCADKSRINYGHSMGAFGALKRAKALGVDAVIAFAPHWSIAPVDLAPLVSPRGGRPKSDRPISGFSA
jgi:hypothetical protein